MLLMKFLIAIVLLFAPAAAFSKLKTVTFITFEAPPFMSPDMPEQGAASYALKQMFKKAGYDCQLIFAPLKRAKVEALKRSNVAGYFLASPFDLAKGFVSTKPVYRSPWVVIERKDKPLHIKDVKDLANYNGGLVMQYTEPPDIQRMIDNKTLPFEEAPNDTLNLLKLATKRLDYILMDASMFKFINAADPRFAEHQNDMQINSRVTYLLDYTVAFKEEKGPEKIMKAFEKAFDKDEFSIFLQEYLTKLAKASPIKQVQNTGF